MWRIDRGKTKRQRCDDPKVKGQRTIRINFQYVQVYPEEGKGTPSIGKGVCKRMEVWIASGLGSPVRLQYRLYRVERLRSNLDWEGP